MCVRERELEGGGVKERRAVSEQANRPNLITARCLSFLVITAANIHTAMIPETLSCSSRAGSNLQIMYVYHVCISYI